MGILFVTLSRSESRNHGRIFSLAGCLAQVLQAHSQVECCKIIIALFVCFYLFCSRSLIISTWYIESYLLGLIGLLYYIIMYTFLVGCLILGSVSNTSAVYFFVVVFVGSEDKRVWGNKAMDRTNPEPFLALCRKLWGRWDSLKGGCSCL